MADKEIKDQELTAEQQEFMLFRGKVFTREMDNYRVENAALKSRIAELEVIAEDLENKLNEAKPPAEVVSIEDFSDTDTSA